MAKNTGFKACAVVQAHNEQAQIANVLRQLYRGGISTSVVVANGCTDSTIVRTQQFFREADAEGKICIIKEPLGPDVGKAVGTYEVLRQKWLPDVIVYVDGDWMGSFGPELEELLREVRSLRHDVVFTERDCVPSSFRHQMRPDVQIWQSTLQQVQPQIEKAAVSESPLLVKPAVFHRISPYWLHQPGLWLAQCLSAPEAVLIGTVQHWATTSIGNPTRSSRHQEAMMETLIGDAVEGSQVILGHSRHRWWHGRERIGYHRDRRLDLLLEFMGGGTIPS